MQLCVRPSTPLHFATAIHEQNIVTHTTTYCIPLPTQPPQLTHPSSQHSQRPPSKACLGCLWALFRYQPPLHARRAIQRRHPNAEKGPKVISGAQACPALSCPALPVSKEYMSPDDCSWLLEKFCLFSCSPHLLLVLSIHPRPLVLTLPPRLRFTSLAFHPTPGQP